MSLKKDDLNLILDVQQKAYKDATELLFNSLNNRIEDQNKVIYDLKKSLEFTQAELQDIKTKNENSQREIQELNSIVSDQARAITDLKNNQEAQEDYSRRRNIKIDGVTDNNQENSEQTQVKVEKILKDNLGLQNVKLETAHRIPRKDNSLKSAPRIIIAQLNKSSDRETIMKNTRKLKNSGIYINEDFCDATNKIRKDLYPQLKKARDEGNIAFIRKRKLIIRKRVVNDTSLNNLPRSRIDHSPHTPFRQSTSLRVNITPRSAELQATPSPLLPRPLENQSPKAKENENNEIENRRSQRNKK